jgi:hypothetical protein
MKQIFKDENLRTELVAVSRARAKLYNWEKTTAIVWHLIEQSVSR